MIDYLNILIDVCVITALLNISKRRPVERHVAKHYYPTKVVVDDKRTPGLLDKALRRAGMAERYAERAFSAANAAALGVIALQKALAIPRPLTKPQVIANKLAKQDIDRLFNANGGWDWMKPYMSEEDLEVIEKIEEEKMKSIKAQN